MPQLHHKYYYFLIFGIRFYESTTTTEILTYYLMECCIQELLSSKRRLPVQRQSLPIAKSSIRQEKHVCSYTRTFIPDKEEKYKKKKRGRDCIMITCYLFGVQRIIMPVSYSNRGNFRKYGYANTKIERKRKQSIITIPAPIPVMLTVATTVFAMKFIF